MTGVKFLLLILIIHLGQSVKGKFSKFGYKGYESTVKTTKFDKANTTESTLPTTKTHIVNKTIDNKNPIFPENITVKSLQKNHIISNQTLIKVLQEAKTCKERYTSGQRLRSKFKGNSSISVFYCNITKELVDGLQDKLNQLEFFHGVIVLYPKINSSNSNGSNAPDKIKIYQGNFSQRNGENIMERAERDALLKNDHIETNTKVSHLSHIYLGRSLYPFFTEESRIIDRDRTLPPPMYTKPIYTDHNKNANSSEKELF